MVHADVIDVCAWRVQFSFHGDQLQNFRRVLGVSS